MWTRVERFNPQSKKADFLSFHTLEIPQILKFDVFSVSEIFTV